MHISPQISAPLALLVLTAKQVSAQARRATTSAIMAWLNSDQQVTLKDTMAATVNPPGVNNEATSEEQDAMLRPSTHKSCCLINPAAAHHNARQLHKCSPYTAAGSFI